MSSVPTSSEVKCSRWTTWPSAGAVARSRGVSPGGSTRVVSLQMHMPPAGAPRPPRGRQSAHHRSMLSCHFVVSDSSNVTSLPQPGGVAPDYRQRSTLVRSILYPLWVRWMPSGGFTPAGPGIHRMSAITSTWGAVNPNSSVARQSADIPVRRRGRSPRWGCRWWPSWVTTVGGGTCGRV